MTWRDKRGLNEQVPRSPHDNGASSDSVGAKLTAGHGPLPEIPLLHPPADPRRRTDVVEEQAPAMAPRIEAAAAVAPVTRRLQTDGDAVGPTSDRQAAQAFDDAIQPVWDAFARSIRSTAADFNRAAGHDVVAVPDDAGDLVRMRTAHAEWTETFDIRLDRTARAIVGGRREVGPGVGRALSHVAMPTLMLDLTEAPLRFGGQPMTAADAGAMVVKRIVADLTRHLPAM